MEVPYSRTIIGGLPWYSVLVVGGILLAVWLSGCEEKRLGMPADTTVDLALWVIPCGIIGARLYYVLMRWEAFAAHPLSILYIWQGGLGIYGGIIGGAVGAFVYSRRKKIGFASLADMIVPGLLLAQFLGRWGNYFNMEAYGPEIQDVRLQFFPLAVYIPANEKWHAATFFYESMWNLAGFAAIWLLRKKQNRPGNVLAWYLLIYGAGRFVIEQLREDSLYIGTLRASQWLSLILCVSAAVLLVCRAGAVMKRRLWAGMACILLWVLRWFVLDTHAVYMLLMASAWLAALWLCRKKRFSLLWVLSAVLVDGIGLLIAISEYPIAVLSWGIHAVSCSLTLPMGIWALCSDQE